MIASADFCRPTNTLAFAGITVETYDDDSLVPGADPYIAQLFAEHQAELSAIRQSRLPAEFRSYVRTVYAEPQLAVA